MERFVLDPPGEEKARQDRGLLNPPDSIPGG